MERTGAAQLLASSVTAAEALGPYAILAALIVLASLLSQGLDGAPAVVLMAPMISTVLTTIQITVLSSAVNGVY